MVKKTITILIIVVLAWWGYGFVCAILDSRANLSSDDMNAKMEQLDPIRKSGYRTYKANFTGDSKAVSDINKKNKALDELSQ